MARVKKSVAPGSIEQAASDPLNEKKTKLENSRGLGRRIGLEPRIQLEDPEKSYHAPHSISDNDLFDNRLIFYDNLLALNALEQEFTDKI